MADIALQHAGQVAGVEGGTEVDYFQFGVELFGKYTDGCAATRKILYHFGGDELREGRYIFFSNAMVTREDADEHLVELRFFAALHRGKLNRDGFQLTERARRFGELLLARLCGAACGYIQVFRGLLQPVQIRIHAYVSAFQSKWQTCHR